MSRVLFVCGKARKRSPTAADVAGRRFGCATDFAGLSNEADARLARKLRRVLPRPGAGGCRQEPGR